LGVRACSTGPAHERTHGRRLCRGGGDRTRPPIGPAARVGAGAPLGTPSHGV